MLRMVAEFIIQELAHTHAKPHANGIVWCSKQVVVGAELCRSDEHVPCIGSSVSHMLHICIHFHMYELLEEFMSSYSLQHRDFFLSASSVSEFILNINSETQKVN